MSDLKPKAFNAGNEEKKVREEFAARYEELKTVSAAPTTENLDGLPNPYNAMPVLPFMDPQQQVVLLNITHRQQIPKSKIPGFRVCGAFENVDKLKRQVQSAGGPSAFGGANLIKADMHKKFLICSSLDKQQSPTYVLNKIDEATQRYLKMLDFHTEEFKENKENRRQGKTGLSQAEKIKKVSSRKQILDKKFEEEKEKGSETGEVSRNAEVRGQSVAVVTILEDQSPPVLNGVEDPEPIVIVWGCFENEAQAKHYIYNTASKYVKDVMLDVVNMYEWVYPTEISKHVDEITEEFRNPSLNKVMNSRKLQKKSVLSYDEWCKREGQEASSLEINAIKETEDSTEVKTEVKKTEDLKITVATKSTEKKMDEKSNDTEQPVDWKPVVTSKVNELYKDVTFKDDSVDQKTTEPPQTTQNEDQKQTKRQPRKTR
jgi:hypothetical protein